uniref:acid phosphatase n=1 Tax=Cyanoderma ruficeps TaxID=181631 RepID=A0A8C3XDJ6_9PASS
VYSTHCHCIFLVTTLISHNYHKKTPVIQKQFHLFYQVFRHGDHTPQEFFPTDKHKEIARQQGYSQLTKLGIQQQYELGQYMRRRYSHFLSVVYKQCEIYVQSTDYDHTLMSAQASLAGLYPPTQGQIWNHRILWQPIPVHTVPLAHDNVSAPKSAW